MIAALTPQHPQAGAVADARRQSVKLTSECCEPFATKPMRPDRLARRVNTPLLALRILQDNAAFSRMLR
jgi:hypothetical protein